MSKAVLLAPREEKEEGLVGLVFSWITDIHLTALNTF